jgi:hypothetical protein
MDYIPTKKGSMLSLQRKITLTAAAGAAIALLAAGCGTSSPSASSAISPARAIILTADQARQVSSFASVLSVRLTGSVSGTMTGTMRLRSKPSLLADADFSTISFGGQALPGGMQEILTNSSIYLKLGALQQRIGKPWIEISYAALQKGTGVDLSQLTQQVQENNPLVQAQMLAGAKDVRDAGTQTIDGVLTTHYTGSYPLSAGLARLPASLRSLEQKALARLDITTVQFNVWIDAQHQMRKMTAVEVGTGQRIDVSMQLTGINQPVDVTPPPASQVATIPASALG